MGRAIPAKAGSGSPAPLPFRSVFVAIGGIYVAQGMVSGLTFQAMPAILRSQGLPLDRIGLVSLALLPWAFKFLWAPWIERYRHGSTAGRSTTIIVIGECLVAAALFTLAAIGPADLAPVMLILGLCALASATVDIACDGFAVEQLSADRRGWGNTAQVGGSYLGFMVGGGAYLWVVAAIGFGAATLALGLSLLAVTALFPVLMRRPRPVTAFSHRPSLRYAFRRREVRLGLLLVVICGLGPRIAASLTAPFLIDRGLDLRTLGLLNGAAGTAAGLLGTLLGGSLVQALGSRGAVLVALMLELVALLSLVWASATPQMPVGLLVWPVIGLTAAMAVGFVAMYALLMGASSRRQAGVDFTLFQCADAVVATVGGMSGGLLASAFGYAPALAMSSIALVSGLVCARLFSSQITTPSDEAMPCPSSVPSS
jgi:MFS transporter (putative signal transducer)